MRDLEVIHELKGRRFLFAVETSDKLADYAKFEELRYEIWEDPDDNFSAARNMAGENIFNDGSSLYIGIYIEGKNGGFPKNREHLIGFSYGYVGIIDLNIGYRNPANLEFYSQYASVKTGFQKYGLGFFLKQFQRQKVIEILGINTITCTFDPLTGVNAYRNFHIFGMEVIAYKEAFYKGFAGKLNRVDVPSDRLFVSWDLKKEIKRPKYDLELLLEEDRLIVYSESREVRGKTGQVCLPVAKKGSYSLCNIMLIEIPYDFYTVLQETDVLDKEVRNIPVYWRKKTKEAFCSILKDGYKIIDFRYKKIKDRMRDFYVLSKGRK
ncbi:unnamed protein product [marine sediment metagenome]|uniref:N-acetyltransferase domain-containing protein n=1 Tax=marine sediment metagenome TaxID=412755 RepID=X1ABP2_9ZZZZ